MANKLNSSVGLQQISPGDCNALSVILFNSNRDIFYREVLHLRVPTAITASFGGLSQDDGAHGNEAVIAVGALSRDDRRTHDDANLLLHDGIDNADLKGWLAKRILLQYTGVSPAPDNIDKNIRLAMNAISLIDPTISYHHISKNSFDIWVQAHERVILLEALSSGYRTILFIILGLIKEIELRFEGSLAADFEGVVLIDEIDLHLHPEWQRKVVSILRNVFPKVQFIVTTHSPHVIQAVEPGEVIALARDESGAPHLLELPDLPHGFKGWSVEEILHDVMGMQSTQSIDFDEAITEFNRALNDDDAEKVIHFKDILLGMLHSRNPARKLIRMQAAAYQVTELT
jgi:hypothetical protein